MSFGIDYDGEVLIVRSPKHPSPEIKEELGGRWNKQERVWRVQPTALNVLKLGEWYGVDFIGTAPQEVQDIFYLDWGFPGFEAHSDLKAKAEGHPRWNDLYPFQKIAVEYCVCNPHRGALVGLSPGLGKTVVTIVAMDILEAVKALILAPLTLAKNWGKEVEAWSQYDRDWSRTTAEQKNPTSDLTITNFETVFYTVLRDEDGKVYTEDSWEDLSYPESILDADENDGWSKSIKQENRKVELHRVPPPRDGTKVSRWIKAGPKKDNGKGKQVPVRERLTQARPTYADSDWDMIVIDESILMKNRKAVKVDVVQTLTKYAHFVLLLSGSATAKFRDDLFPQVQTIKPKAFSSYWRFAEFFTIVEKGQWGWSIEGDRPDHDPQKYLKDFYIVMNQKDVLPDLPDYIYDPIEIDLMPEQRKAFDQMVEEWIVALEAEEDEVPDEVDLEATGRLAQQQRMLQITSNLCNLTKGAGKPMPSISAKENLLVDLINMGDIEFPLLVWTWFQPTTESVDARLEKEFKNLNVAYVHGGLKAEDKDLGIEMYKDGELDVLILQMGVGKFGHTLTDTRTVYYHDRTFESDAWIQTLRRVKRIGLKHRPRLIVPRAENSADPLVEMNLAGKMQSIAKVASHDLAELLRSVGGLAWSMDSYDTNMDV